MTPKKYLSAFAALASVVTGVCGAAHADAKLPARDKMFVTTVSQANTAEIMTAKLALQKSQNPKVRTIAETIVKDHSTAQDSLKQVAEMYKVTLPMMADAKHKSAYAKLEHMSGTSFDRAYLKGQVKDHYAAVNLFKKEMAMGNDSQVRSFAAKYLPTIEYHTKLITAAASNRGIQTATKTGMTPAKMQRMKKAK